MIILTMLKRCKIALKPLFFVLLSSATVAQTFTLPPPGDSLIGHIQYSPLSLSETPATVAQHYNLGLNAIVDANPGSTETRLAPYQYIKIASLFLLPPLPRKGIVINLPEMRLYYYPNGTDKVMTFPVGIGKIGKTIPISNTMITRKAVNPTWIPPEDIRAFNRDQGVELPHAMPAGPDNPLGPYAIYLRLPTYLIHSTIFPESIGRRASFGCIRMNETDIKQFFPLVEAGIPVVIIDMPNKIAWNADRLYLEAHTPLEERSDDHHATYEGMIDAINQAIPRNAVVFVNWQTAAYLAEQPDAIPHEIGMMIRG